MGYNTTVLILNDQLGEITADPQRFVDALYHQIIGGRHRLVPGQVTVMPTAHADQFRLYATQGNCITELSAGSRETMGLVHGEPFQRQLVERLIGQAQTKLDELRLKIRDVDSGRPR